MKTIRKYGKPPFRIGLLHGGPGASGEMRPVAENLSNDFGILELLQTESSVNGQVKELYKQLVSCADLPVVLVGHSWGAWLGFLFAARYNEPVKKLILIGAGAFDRKYNTNLERIRFDRLNQQEREEAERLKTVIKSGDADNGMFKRFGELMTIADSYDYQPIYNDMVEYDMDVFQSVWTEAARLRDTGKLIDYADKIKCSVVAIHGDYDPHPIDGVEKPLSEKISGFRMIRIAKCGHTPWKERLAKDTFFKILRQELHSVRE